MNGLPHFIKQSPTSMMADKSDESISLFLQLSASRTKAHFLMRYVLQKVFILLSLSISTFLFAQTFCLVNSIPLS